MVYMLSCVPPASQSTLATPVTVVPWGPVTVKSQTSTVLQRTGSEKLKVSELIPHDGEPDNELKEGAILSKITAVDTEKSMV